MLENIPHGGTYFFFAANALLALFFVIFFVPETRGKSLEDMDVVFGDTAAHEEKTRLYQIAAQLEGRRLNHAEDLEKSGMQQEIEVTSKD
jgi:Sugar (and other) transporter